MNSLQLLFIARYQRIECLEHSIHLSHNPKANTIDGRVPMRKEQPIFQEMSSVHGLMLSLHRNSVQLEMNVKQSTSSDLRPESRREPKADIVSTDDMDKAFEPFAGGILLLLNENTIALKILLLP
jgi:calcineurin-like phosphoesterase family protein